MRQFNFKHNKLASAMITNIEFVKEVAKEKKHTFISTGMTQYEEIELALEIFNENSCDYTLMHTVSTYPMNDNDANLNMIKTLKDRYKCKVGYSGHEVGILPSVLAAMLGASAIERHITLDRSMYGSDQSASLEEDGVKRLVRDIRSIDSILENGKKYLKRRRK